MSNRIDYDLDEWRAADDTNKARWGGWEWATETHVHRTNERGEGLWELDEDHHYIQIEGTSQFSLPRDRTKALAKLKYLEMTPRERRNALSRPRGGGIFD